ncbi:MAG: 1-deoxy-D-xylulose-5-phosphate reductoisomerase, partial [Blastocatellia bacterium]|nr:1-deoxy-D-xylulose-5-phosphate reductoisomerase [Blastocatellia bacterium]
MKGIAILGSTGSIGCNTLKVIEHLGEHRVVAMAAGRNMSLFAEQVARFQPDLVSCENEQCADELREILRQQNAPIPTIRTNDEGLNAVADHPLA